MLGWIEQGSTPVRGTVRAGRRKVGLTTWNSGVTVSAAGEVALQPAAAMAPNGNATLTCSRARPRDVARQAVWAQAPRRPGRRRSSGLASGALGSPQLVATDAASVALWLRTPVSGPVTSVLARLDGSTVNRHAVADARPDADPHTRSGADARTAAGADAARTAARAPRRRPARRPRRPPSRR